MRDFLPKHPAHRRPKRHAQLDLIEAEVPFVRVHDPVVVHHSQHQRSRESVPVEESDRRHRVRQDAPPQRVQTLREEPGRERCMLEIQAIGVEFGDAGGGDDYAGGVAGFEDVEGEEDGLAEGLWRGQ